jgi:hypothetical protein
VAPQIPNEELNNKTYNFMMYFKNFDVEESVEALAYDMGAFLAEAGGNLGLALGFSCLSIILGFINCVNNLFSKYFGK